MQDFSTTSSSHPPIAGDLNSLLFALDAIGIGLWEWNIKTNIVVCDDCCKALFALKGGTIGYEEVTQHIHPDDVTRVKASVAAAMNGAEKGHYEERYRTIEADDGQLRWVHHKGQVYFDQAGHPDRLVSTAQDITAHIAATEEMAAQTAANKKTEESEQNLRNMILQAPVAMTILRGPEFVVDVANSLMLTHWQRSAEEVINRPVFEVLTEAKGRGFEELLQKVYTTGETISAYGAPIPLLRDGRVETIYVTFAYQPYREQNGAIAGVMAVAIEVTDQVLAQRRVEESQLRLLNSFEQSPVAIALIHGSDLSFQMANPFYGELVGRKPDELVGKPLLEALPELQGQGFDELLKEVIATGIPYIAKEVAVNIVHHNQLNTIYVDLTYQPQIESDHHVSGVLVVATDVTAQVLARKKIEVSENRFRALIQSAPVGIGLFVGRDLVIEEPNQTFIDIIGKGWDIVGKKLAEAMPELEGQTFLQILDDVYTSGKTFHTFGTQVNVLRQGVMTHGFYDFSYTPLFDTDGKVYAILDTSMEVTDQVLARKKIEESELFARNILENSPIAKIVFTGEDMVMSVVNEKMLTILGRDASIIGKPFMEAVPELISTPLMTRLRRVLATGETFYSAEEKFDLIRFGKPYTGYYSYTCKALHNTDGEIYGIINTAIEVTEQVLARQKMEEAEEALRGAIELAELGTWSIDLPTGLLHYSDRLKSWFGIEEKGPITIEQAYSPIVKSDWPLVRASMTHAITPGTDGIYDVEYSTIDQKTGRQRIIHAQGKALIDEQGVTYKVNGTAQDVTEQRKTQLALEQQVQERTEELAAINEELVTINEEVADANDRLQRSNEELAQYAYVASHDLQEPLRKIRMFSGMLYKQKDLSEENTRLIAKINQSSERMTLLIQDLLEFSRLLNSEALMKPVDLGEICQMVVNDFELAIAEKSAVVKIGSLPIIEAVSLQMNQLFYNLLSNALKFGKPSITPLIEIDARLISIEVAREYIFNPDRHCNYYHITFSDNGIGFEEKYSEQIFEVFKRLHGRDAYPGSGIGLALCRRIVANQKGHLYATSIVGEGTTFHIILPDQQEEK